MANLNPVNTNDIAGGSIDEVAFALAANLPSAWQVTTEGVATAPPLGNVPQPTMTNPLIPLISWPGAQSIVAMTYMNSHGISPGGICLTINPQEEPPEVFGDLVFGDGIRPPITLRDCHLDRMPANVSSGGLRYDLHISDRRWRWQQGYMIRGEYNRVDEHSNFVPWTVQSATELAELCLEAMGETNYQIAFPPGLTHARAVNTYDAYLKAGQRFPLTLANPNVVWDHIPAAVALQRLADLFGCRVMYDPIADRVGIFPQGYGSMLPYGGTSVAVASQGIESARVPQFVGVCGAPMKFQMRVALEHVGIEWNDYITRADLLTYAPILKAANAAAGNAGAAVYGWDNCPPPTFTTVEATDQLAYPEAIQKAQDGIFRMYRVREYQYLNPHGTITYGNRSPGGIDVSQGQAAFIPIRVPGLNDDIVTGLSTDTGQIPEGFQSSRIYGELARRQQLILTPLKVDQVIPQDRRDKGVVAAQNPVGIGPGTLPDYYNGYSRDRPAECFGTHSIFSTQNGFHLTANADANGFMVTKKRIYIPFSVNPVEQTVTFSQHLYAVANPSNLGIEGWFPASDLFIETGVHVLEPDTNAVIRCKYTMWLGGDAPPVWETHEDIITHIIGEYDGVADNSSTTVVGANNLTGYHVSDFGDGAARAAYYLQGMKRRFQNWQSQTIEYNGCMLISPSGCVQQIRWTISSAGIKTMASVNSEFSQNMPPYAVRKLPENMPPNEMAKLANHQYKQTPFTASDIAALHLYKRGQ